jgi:hypothetical protein
MAAGAMLDFGVAPVSSERSEKSPEADAQQIQSENLNRLLPEKTAEATSSLEPAGQIGKLLTLPFSVMAIASQMDSLPTSDDVEVRPTNYAYLRAKQSVLAAYVSMLSEKTERIRIPTHPIIGTDDVGGVLVSWASGDKYVAVKFGAQPDSRSFVYFEQGEDHHALDLSEKNLLEKLKWLSA